MSKTAIVILNWNGRELLEKFLPSVVCHAEGADVYIADNASTDDSLSFIKKNFPTVKVVLNAVNGGFAKGYNDALKHIEADYYVLLNSDVEVTQGWLESTVALMDADTSIAACQPKLLDFTHKSRFEYAGGAGGFIDKYGYPFCRGRIFATFEEDTGQYNDVREIHWATGACLFIRAKLFHDAGGFDEDFFAHMEEIDLCWRLKNAGYKIMYNPASHVYHLGGGTLNKLNPRKTYYNFRNNLILLCKNHAHKYFWIKLFIRFVLDGIAGVKFIFSGEPEHCVAVIKAHFSFYATFFKTLKKRKTLRGQVKLYSTTAIYRKSILVDYFIRKKQTFLSLDQSAF